jgi:hypothetical protein
MRIYRTLGAHVCRAAGRRGASDDGSDVDDARSFPEVLERRLCSQRQAEHINVEVSVEIFFRDVLQGRESVNA